MGYSPWGCKESYKKSCFKFIEIKSFILSIFFSYISKIFIKWHFRALLHAGDMVVRKTDMTPAFTEWMAFGGSFGLCTIGE